MAELDIRVIDRISLVGAGCMAFGRSYLRAKWVCHTCKGIPARIALLESNVWPEDKGIAAVESVLQVKKDPVVLDSRNGIACPCAGIECIGFVWNDDLVDRTIDLLQHHML